MQIHKRIHTYFLPIVQTNHRPKNRHLGYLNSQHHPHLSGLLIAFQSSQARFLFLTFKILLPPNCLFNFITNSPAPQPTVLFTVPKCSHHSPTCFYSCCFWIAILIHYWPCLSLWWEVGGKHPRLSQLSTCMCHVTRVVMLLGTGTCSALSVSPQGPAFQFWVHLEVLFCFAIGKGPEVKRLA